MADNWDTTPGRTGRRTIDQIMGDTTTTGGTGDGDTTSTKSSTESSSSKSDSDSDKYDEVKDTVVMTSMINTYAEALDFAKWYWNKIRRDNGRVLQCQVWGSPMYQSGEWAKVYLPTFDIDDYMYITGVSQSNENGDWTCNLTLVDFPPGWGKEEIEEEDEEDDEDEDSSSSSE